MGSTNYLGKPKSAGYRVKSGSSAGSDKEMNGKLRRAKIRRPTKMNEYGLKRLPDYTELAYKEAVSKLRYFLSGNYAPSVRSYGGSASIKNLDESDGDLDKKYSTYNTLSEYKPRPRLTAKYATLYADSLNNYTPQHVTNPIPAGTTPATDLSGGTNPDVINFIQKQEEYIEQLERESQYCRDELNNLLGKVKEVITENENLHEAQKNKLISRMFHTYNNGSETDELDDLGDSTGLESDNKGTPKSRKSMKTRSTRLEGPNIVFESRIAELEAQLTQSKIDLKKSQDENNENKRKLASGLVDSTCLDGFKRQIDNLQRDKSSLEAQIAKLKLNLESKDGDLDGRYKRGSDALENQLREERNNLEAEIRRLKDDLAKERTKVRELAGEGARRAIQERSAAEQRYNAHFDELQHDLAAQYENVTKMQLDLERQRREENDLKRELSMKNAAVEELRMELKNKTASLQADLAQAHAEKASLDEELASARLAIERQQRQAKHETNRLNSEIQSLRQRLDRADADLVHSRRENLRLSEQISTLEKELNMKTLTPISPEKNKKEKELSTMLESMENKHAKTVAGLESMIQSQNSLMEKLTGECRLLTDKLDDANRRHKADKTQLLCRNAELMRKLRNLWSSHKKYCTTTITPYRSYTPLSGYPNSHSSYDLERTYYTSTPCTNRYRFRRSDDISSKDTPRDDLGELTRELSDLSIDKIEESGDDPTKIFTSVRVLPRLCVCFREELATLQRQVENLGRSLQPAAIPSLSTYQAQPSHTPTTNRTVPHSIPNARSDHTGADPSGDSHIGDAPLTSLRPDRINRDDDQTPRTRRQDSRNSLLSDTTPKSSDHVGDFENTTEINEGKHNKNQVYKDNEVENPMEIEPERQQEYESESNYNEGNFNYEQNYDQEHPAEYQNQEYDQNYEQQPYTEQYENYEQYPQEYTDPNLQYTDPNAHYTDPNAQYTDPNVQYSEPNAHNTDPTTEYSDPSAQYTAANEQYEAQFDNYGHDGKSPTEQTYDNTQYAAEMEDDQGKQNVVETKQSDSRNEKVHIQS